MPEMDKFGRDGGLRPLVHFVFHVVTELKLVWSVYG